MKRLCDECLCYSRLRDKNLHHIQGYTIRFYFCRLFCSIIREVWRADDCHYTTREEDVGRNGIPVAEIWDCCQEVVRLLYQWLYPVQTRRLLEFHGSWIRARSNLVSSNILAVLYYLNRFTPLPPGLSPLGPPPLGGERGGYFRRRLLSHILSFLLLGRLSLLGRNRTLRKSKNSLKFIDLSVSIDASSTEKTGV
ncbi:uncharacterized protein LOC126748304 [Anthonomus grandis grandis]|uniref:uncharacterized protein LOC126748304 n=1 Tax=Anthonomus grandis grandis TaxID=2921223 RepID=UPI00216558B6|nr:uncharacterized protein LOC126748304 [Anthonomus grandis grandis]